MWIEQDNSLRQEFTFPDFAAALAFVNQVGALAEKANHHPDIELGWGRVVMSLQTHEAGGVTVKDKELAAQIDAIG